VQDLTMRLTTLLKRPPSELEAFEGASGKITLLAKLLPKLKREGHKVLIFSQFKIMLGAALFLHARLGAVAFLAAPFWRRLHIRCMDNQFVAVQSHSLLQNHLPLLCRPDRVLPQHAQHAPRAH
jgi:hypothetical protein